MDTLSRMDPFGARASLGPGLPDLYRVSALEGATGGVALPVTVTILLENLLRHAGGGIVEPADVETLASWRPGIVAEAEIPFMPSRVIMQDLTGVPAVVDLAVMRDAMADLGGDPARVNPLVPADLVIDHSVQVDRFGTSDSFVFNVGREYDRNGERYQLLRWAQTAFRNLRIVPPGTGIVHQVNLEFLAPVVEDRDGVAFPDTLVGTDSHTTMINALGVLGYGVGGIEAEAVLLGQPLYQPMPHVVGVRLTGQLPHGSTATDLVLVVTEMLRGHGVVGAFVEFAGDGLAGLSLADRATISNMSPEFGATATLFPIDDETISYLRLTGRSPERVALVERYAREQGLWREPGDGPAFDELLTLDLGSVEPSLAGPRRPQDRVPLESLRENFRSNFPEALVDMSVPVIVESAEDARDNGDSVEQASAESFPASDSPAFASVGGREPAPPARAVPDDAPVGHRREYPGVDVTVAGQTVTVRTGSVAIAAITSCTNTSNPTVMVGAGLLARNAIARGLRVAPTVKTSLAPGSRAVTGYLESAGLMAPLAELGFALAGYGCTTCIGNSGPLGPEVAEAIEHNDLIVAAVLSGNRNFEGRIHPLARASYLASPPLVVAFALAGRVDIDLTTEPLGVGSDGSPVFLADVWPSPDEIRSVIADSIDPELFRQTYAVVFEGDERWRALPIPEGDRYAWDPASTYVAKPPFFEGLSFAAREAPDLTGARALAVLGDSVTTDHISPAGSIAAWSPAGKWLQERGVGPLEFNSYGARRGHHEVMMRGTFGNIRLRNRLSEGKEGRYTTHLPSGD
jgi:aconitate hydratase